MVQSKGMDYPAVDTRGTKGMALSFCRIAERRGPPERTLALRGGARHLRGDIRKETGIDRHAPVLAAVRDKGGTDAVA